MILNWVVFNWVWVSSDELDCISINDSGCFGWSLDDSWDKLLSSSKEATLLVDVEEVEYNDLKSGSFASSSIRWGTNILAISKRGVFEELLYLQDWIRARAVEATDLDCSWWSGEL